MSATETRPPTPTEIMLNVYNFALELESAKERCLQKTHPGLDGQQPAYDAVSVKERKKFFAIDFGTSGAFLVEKTTGEIYNIKAYGVPDYNKKQKADLGNVTNADADWVYARRYNYLR